MSPSGGLQLPVTIDVESAMILDRYYIPTRYPDGLPDLTPSEAYGKRDADEGIKIAGLILDIIRKNIGNV